ncbi:MAG: hypothetical protein JWQ03_1917, partial [Variovorax sp.]|nr:hypothetical protein [Variovorax sp.]
FLSVTPRTVTAGTIGGTGVCVAARRRPARYAIQSS